MMQQLRADQKAIAEWVEKGSRVLDVGCGDGELLAWLVQHKGVDGRGLELEQELVAQAVTKGLSVFQGDANTDLSYYPDQTADYVILGQTLQRMAHPEKILCELLRVGKRAIVSVPNFAHWRNRLHLALCGRMPVTRALSYEWYETPNIHFCSIADFVRLCQQLGIRIEKRHYVTHGGEIGAFSGAGMMANLFGEVGLFLLSADVAYDPAFSKKPR